MTQQERTALKQTFNSFQRMFFIFVMSTVVFVFDNEPPKALALYFITAVALDQVLDSGEMNN